MGKMDNPFRAFARGSLLSQKLFQDQPRRHVRLCYRPRFETASQESIA